MTRIDFDILPKKGFIPGHSSNFSFEELRSLFSQLNIILNHSSNLDDNFLLLTELIDKLCISSRKVLYKNVTSDARTDGKSQFDKIVYKLLSFPAHLGRNYIPTTPANIRQKIIVAYSTLTTIYRNFLI